MSDARSDEFTDSETMTDVKRVELEARIAELERREHYGVMSWQSIATAPKDGRFVVYAAGCGYLMVMDGRMLAWSRWPHTPKHLSGSHWTHWIQLPT